MNVGGFQLGGVMTARALSLMIALTLECVSTFAFGAADAGGGPKGGDAPDPAGLEDSFVEVERTRLHVVRGGAGRQTVVLLHGNAGSTYDFERGLAELLSKSYRIVAFDRPGHGKSDRPGRKAATVEYQARMLHDALRSIGVSDPILVGHSWGASLALRYALDYPEETAGLVLLAPAAFPDADPNPLLRALVRTPLVGGVTLFVGKRMLGLDTLRRELTRAFYPQPVPESYMKMAASTWLGRRQLRSFIEDEWSLNASLRGMSARYGELRLPVVIVTGDEDQIVSPRENALRLKEMIPRARLVELKGAGHQIPLTRPGEVYGALKLLSQSETN